MRRLLTIALLLAAPTAWAQSAVHYNRGTQTTLAGDSSTAVNLSGVISATTGAAANVTTGETDLLSCALPVKTLSTRGRVLRITAWGALVANGNTKTLRVYLGTLLVFGRVFNSASITAWRIEAYVIRSGANTQLSSTTAWVSPNDQNNITLNNLQNTTSGSQDEATALTLKVTGQSNAASNDIVHHALIVEVLN